ncbi:MAG: NifU family protein [Bacteroidales bacterium]
MKKCSQCGLPLKHEETSHTGGSVCEICFRYEKKWRNYDFKKAYKELVKIIEFYQTKKNKYDCIVPISGGKDSTYVLHYLKRVMKLNTLAVNYDNGFQTQQAYLNLKKAIEKTGSAYISYRLPWEKLQQLYKDYTLKSGGDICGTCNMGVSHAIYKIADSEKTPLIIWGYSSIHENTPIFEGKRYCREKMYRKAIIDCPANSYADEISYDYYKRRNDFVSLYLFNYIPYDETEILNTLKNEYEWEEATHGSNKADCDIFNISNYYKVKNNGYGRLNIKYAALIRDGQIEKDKAYEILTKQETGALPIETESVLRRIDVSLNELENAKGRRLDYVQKVNDVRVLEPLKDLNGNTREKLKRLLQYLKPEVKRDGGTIEFVRIENGFLYFKLGGDCKGCFLQQVMTNYIDSLLIRYIPELNGSFPVYDIV